MKRILHGKSAIFRIWTDEASLSVSRLHMIVTLVMTIKHIFYKERH